MKLTQKKIDDYTIELTVTEDAAAFSKEIKRTTKALGERVNIPGFRKGKVPLPLIERHVGREAIIDEATEALLQRTTREALRILNLVPVSENKADVVTNEEGKDFVFTLTFTPFPQVKLGEYKGLEAEKVVEPVTDEDIDKQVEALRGHHANLIEAAEDDAIVDGDFITLDYTGTVDGEKFAGGEAKDAPLEIGAHKFIGDFEEQLIGAKVGEERTVKVTFPDEYHAKDLEGRDAEFACKINSIKHRELPELNDEFIAKFTTFKTLDEYKADVRKNLETNAERRAVEAQHQAIIDKAVANMTIDLPPVMIENRIDQMINDLSAQLQSQGMKLEQYMAFSGVDMDKMREDYREAAKKNVLTDIMLEQVAEAEKIGVEQNELAYEIEMMAHMYRTPAKQIAKFLQENGQLINVISTIRRRKAVKFILDNMVGAEKPEVKAPVEETKAAEAPVKEVKAAEAPVKEVKAAEAPVKEAKPVAAPVKEVKAAEAPVKEVKPVAAPVKEAKAAEAPVKEVKAAEAPVKEAKEAEAPVKEVKPVAAPVKEAKAAEAPVKEVKAAEAPVKEAKEAEAPVKEVKPVAAPVKEAKAAEAPVKEVKAAEAPVKEAKEAEAPVKEAKAVEAPVKEVKAAEAPVKEVKAAEAPVKAVKDTAETKED